MGKRDLKLNLKSTRILINIIVYRVLRIHRKTQERLRRLCRVKSQTRSIMRYKDQDKDKGLTPKDQYKDKDLTPKDKNKDKDLIPKDQDKDKDLKYVLKDKDEDKDHS